MGQLAVAAILLACVSVIDAACSVGSEGTVASGGACSHHACVSAEGIPFVLSLANLDSFALTNFTRSGILYEISASLDTTARVGLASLKAAERSASA